MPYIDSKISVKITDAQEKEIKRRLGEAIAILPGKSEAWLMVGFQPEYKLYFKGDNSKPLAFVDVSILGNEDPKGFEKMTGAICDIFNEVLGIAPDCVYVKYSAVKSWGWNGSNF
ncbi:MAG: phenylpyruvate tautomerase MIF-related protein [Lachnospiraceae bacterium]|nr:phenylpyruvate tautomerase MIF-related protein [Lachnospiraceae bacterium]